MLLGDLIRQTSISSLLIVSSLVRLQFLLYLLFLPWSDFNFFSTYCFFLGSSLITWNTKKQTVVSRSSDEDEALSYMLWLV
jgi:hypothetical protein